jgi:hypothetical protein
MEEVEGGKVGFEGEEKGSWGGWGKERKGTIKFGGTRINVRSLNDGKIEGDFRCSILNSNGLETSSNPGQSRVRYTRPEPSRGRRSPL